jgi:hypothetical protein
VAAPAPTRRTGFLGALMWTLLALLLLGLVSAHAQDQSIHYDHWTSTDGWHGETFHQGTTEETREWGPHGPTWSAAPTTRAAPTNRAPARASLGRQRARFALGVTPMRPVGRPG